MSWYRTGTISLANGSTAVTGSGTAWIANAAAGEALLAPDGKLYEIAGINSDTALTLVSGYLGSGQSGQGYVIVPTQGYLRDLAVQASALVNNYATAANTTLAGKFADGTVSAPGVTFQNDLDTGLFRSGANTLEFVAGGGTIYKIDASALSIADGKFKITGSADATKAAVFEVDGFTTATTRTFTLPNADATLVGADTAQTLTNKTLASPALTGTPTAPTATAGTNTTQVATTAFVHGEVATLVNSAPAALDTLNELAAALGNDANFATTVTNSLSTKTANSAAAITGGSINGTTIGGTTPAAATFTALTTTGAVNATGPHTVTGNNLRITSTFDGLNGILFFRNQSGVDMMQLFAGPNEIDFYSPANVSQKFFAGALERLRITSNGNLLINTTTDDGVNKLQVDGGINARGGQIKFPAIQNASTDANTLDDYEEGTWTPTLYGATIAGTTGYDDQAGKYTKIGNIVYCYIQLNINSKSGTGAAHIGGLPFVPVGDFGGALTFFGVVATNKQATLHGGWIALRDVSSGAMTLADMSDLGADFQCYGTFFYFV